jgi:hypothetical protein
MFVSRHIFAMCKDYAEVRHFWGSILRSALGPMTKNHGKPDLLPVF